MALPLCLAIGVLAVAQHSSAATGTQAAPKQLRTIDLPADADDWLRLRTPHFDILSSAGERRTKEIARSFETLVAVLTNTSRRFQRSRVPTTVFVFSRRRDSQPYFDFLIEPGTQAAGIYLRHRDGGAMFVDASRPKFERTARHELVHDLLRQSDPLPPLWIEEGLAEFFSSVTLDRDAIVAGRMIEEHVDLLTHSPERSAADILKARAGARGATSPHFYAHSWAAIHWLMQQDHVRFWDFLADVERGVAVEAALKERYGRSLADLTAGVRLMRRQPPINPRRVQSLSRSLTPVSRPLRFSGPENAFSAVAERIDQATLLFELGRFLEMVPGGSDASEQHRRAALDKNPDHAMALASLGDFERAAAAAPDNPFVLLQWAEALLGPSVGPFASFHPPSPADRERFRHARSLAERALQLGGDEARARAFIGTSYLAEEDLSPGIPHLERVRELLPHRRTFALNLYAMYLRSGERDRAAELESAVFARAAEDEVRVHAANILLREETARAHRLANEGRYQEAADLFRDLASTTAAESVRTELESRARQLEVSVARNREVVLYNEALELANENRTREALALLEKLLRTASDPDILDRARTLRSILAE